MRILVAYATADGSTRGIAERIATRLRERGHAAVSRPVHEVSELSPYDGFVVGSAIHGQAWLPEAARFMQSHHDVLRGHPTWLFSVGMPGALAKPLQKWAGKEGPKVVEPFADVHAIDNRLFSGVVSKHQLPWVGRVVFRLFGGRYGDFRDWKAIDAWADEIVVALEPVAHI
jgi:menaquinone-dependent protoporphyrinogen oxidase